MRLVKSMNYVEVIVRIKFLLDDFTCIAKRSFKRSPFEAPRTLVNFKDGQARI